MIERIIRNASSLGEKPALVYGTANTKKVITYENLIWSNEERDRFMRQYPGLRTACETGPSRRYALCTENRINFVRALVSLWSCRDHNASIIPIGNFLIAFSTNE